MGGESLGEDLEELFVNRKPVKIILVLNDRFSENYSSKIAEEVDTTYSHTVRTLQKMEDLGLVESSKEGRKKIVKLTDRGKEVARTAGDLLQELKD